MSAYTPTAPSLPISNAPRYIGIFRRLFNALIESRMKAADQQVRRYIMLHGLEVTAVAEAGRVRLSQAGERLPFNA